LLNINDLGARRARKALLLNVLRMQKVGTRIEWHNPEPGTRHACDKNKFKKISGQNPDINYIKSMTNKLTPQTDANEQWVNSCSFEEKWEMKVCESRFARELERKLDEALKIAERAINYLDQSYRDGFCDEASELRAELEQLKEEVK
jgi:hypothetical protein